MTTVIIPAHNEESGIARCLEALCTAERPDELQVIVVCNGCADQTAAVASSFSHVEVIETSVPNKTTALNLGDQAARSYPRVYLDADIELPRRVVDEIAEQLAATRLPAATVRFRIDLSSASNAVRRHYRARARAPYPSHLVGRGVYCLSESGRSRFGEFPPVFGDDLFVQNLFTKEECVTITTFTAVVRPPATISELIRVRSRISRGNREHRELYPNASQPSSGGALIRANLWPWRWLDLATYIFVVGAARLRLRLRLNAKQPRWETTRPAPEGPTGKSHGRPPSV